MKGGKIAVKGAPASAKMKIAGKAPNAIAGKLKAGKSAPAKLGKPKHQKVAAKLGKLKPCIFFQKGTCNHGPKCKYPHILVPKKDKPHGQQAADDEPSCDLTECGNANCQVVGHFHGPPPITPAVAGYKARQNEGDKKKGKKKARPRYVLCRHFQRFADCHVTGTHWHCFGHHPSHHFTAEELAAASPLPALPVVPLAPPLSPACASPAVKPQPCPAPNEKKELGGGAEEKVQIDLSGEPSAPVQGYESAAPGPGPQSVTTPTTERQSDELDDETESETDEEEEFGGQCAVPAIAEATPVAKVTLSSTPKVTLLCNCSNCQSRFQMPAATVAKHIATHGTHTPPKPPPRDNSHFLDRDVARTIKRKIFLEASADYHGLTLSDRARNVFINMLSKIPLLVKTYDTYAMNEVLADVPSESIQVCQASVKTVQTAWSKLGVGGMSMKPVDGGYKPFRKIYSGYYEALIYPDLLRSILREKHIAQMGAVRPDFTVSRALIPGITDVVGRITAKDAAKYPRYNICNDTICAAANCLILLGLQRLAVSATPAETPRPPAPPFGQGGGVV